MRLPQQLQRAMAAEAEAAREARAKVIAAEGEHQASRSLANAAEIISQTPAALQVRKRNALRRLLTLSDHRFERNDKFCPFEREKVCQTVTEPNPNDRDMCPGTGTSHATQSTM